MSKYNSKKVEYNGIKFDSKVELDYYHYLNEQLEKGVTIVTGKQIGRAHV